MRFHGDVLCGRHAEGLVDDHLGGLEPLGVVVGLRVGGVRLPLRQARRADPEAVAHVGPLKGPQAEVGGVAVGGGVGVVYQRGAGPEGVTLVEDRRELLVADLDQAGGHAGGGVWGSHQPGMPHPGDGEVVRVADGRADAGIGHRPAA